MRKPNIIFIMTDHQRGDSIGMVQCGIEAVPNLNKLAQESVTFSRAYNTCPLCVPGRTALATGIYPTRNGVVFNDWQGKSAGPNKTLHEILHHRGYQVSHVGVDHIKVKPDLKESFPFKKWIDQNDYNDYLGYLGIQTEREEKHLTKVNEEIQGGNHIANRYSNTYVSQWQHKDEHFKDNFFTREALASIKDHANKPFALFINYWAPHPPLKIPKAYINLFDPDQIELPINVGIAANNEPDNRRKGVPAQLAKDVDMKGWRAVWAGHLALLRYVDDKIGEVLEEIKKQGLMDHTIIVFTSDHGDHLGQHNMYQKMEMYEQAIHVPLMMKIPGVKAKEINHVVSHLDIIPTLLDQLNIEEKIQFDGVSQKEYIDTGKEDHTRKVYCQYSGNPQMGTIRRAVISKRYKYIYDGTNQPELYDLQEDPLEINNIAHKKEHQQLLQTMYNDCVLWGKQKGDFAFNEES